MAIEDLRSVLGWCTLIDYAVLLFWFVVFILAHDWLHRLHGRWFSMSEEKFDAVHYTLMGVFKLGILLFNLVPYLSMRIVA
ncbi:MAG TPA: hypothetical protein VK714_05795 [Myxococcota bacterium]|nr:hypothetical protein [Myxococcota bacterium]